MPTSDIEQGVENGFIENAAEKKSKQAFSSNQDVKIESALAVEPLETASSSSNDEQTYLKGPQLAILIVTLALGQLIMGLDASIISTALPVITGEFHSLEDVGWYGLVYLLTTTCTQPMWNKAFMFFDIKYTFLLAVVIFELGSIICAVAHSSVVLIFGRAVAGVGQAALLAGGTIVITYRVPLDRRAIYFAILQSVNGIAALCGPPLGGVFTDSERLTWRFCFWINLPFAAILIAVGLVYFKSPPRAGDKASLWQKVLNLDLPGTALFTLVWVCIFMTLENGGSTYAWSDSRVWGWLIGFVLGLGLFVVLQWHQDFLPFYFQAAEGASAKQSGIYLIPLLASIMIGCLGSSILLAVVGALNPFMVFGAVTFTIGSGCLTLLQVETPMGVWIGLQILVGVGFGATLQFALIAIQATIGFEKSAIGNGLFFVSNFGGGSLGVGIAQLIFINDLSATIKAQLPAFDLHAIISAGPTGITTVVPSGSIETLRQIYCLAVAHAFYLPTATAATGALCALGVKWINLKKL